MAVLWSLATPALCRAQHAPPAAVPAPRVASRVYQLGIAYIDHGPSAGLGLAGGMGLRRGGVLWSAAAELTFGNDPSRHYQRRSLISRCFDRIRDVPASDVKCIHLAPALLLEGAIGWDHGAVEGLAGVRVADDVRPYAGLAFWLNHRSRRLPLALRAAAGSRYVAVSLAVRGAL